MLLLIEETKSVNPQTTMEYTKLTTILDSALKWRYFLLASFIAGWSWYLTINATIIIPDNTEEKRKSICVYVKV